MRPFAQPETPHVETANWALAPRRVLWYFPARPKSLFKIPIRGVDALPAVEEPCRVPFFCTAERWQVHVIVSKIPPLPPASFPSGKRDPFKKFSLPVLLPVHSQFWSQF